MYKINLEKTLELLSCKTEENISFSPELVKQDYWTAGEGPAPPLKRESSFLFQKFDCSLGRPPRGPPRGGISDIPSFLRAPT